MQSSLVRLPPGGSAISAASIRAVLREPDPERALRRGLMERLPSQWLSLHSSARVLVNMEPGIADSMYANQGDRIEEIERRFETVLIPVARQGYHREHYEVVKSPEVENEW